MPTQNWQLWASAATILLATSASAQSSSTTADCVSLQGSKQCPSFQDAYINPVNLSSAWPWMAEVTDVDSFDKAAENYFNDPNQYHKTKFNVQLQCNTTAADASTLQWQRTIYCGQWSQISYSAQCNVANRKDAIMVCQDTCKEYAATESTLVTNPQICPANSTLTADQQTSRQYHLTKDYTDCTDWHTLTSATNTSCIEGIQNEGNCGWGPYINNQLCAYCDPSGNKTISACCYDSKTDLSGCSQYGNPLAAAIRPTMSLPAGVGGATETAPYSANNATSSDSDDTGLSKGALAGIIVGSIVGAALLGGILAFFLASRRKNSDPEAPPRTSSGGVYSDKGGWRQSDEGTTRSPSSPHKEKYASDAALAGSGAAAGTGFGFLSAIKGNGGATSPESRPISSLSASSGTDGRGTTVPAVRDQYSGHDIVAGETVVAIYPYNASLNDELTLEVDEVITVDKLYDDGWALGKSASGSEGAFPLVCVTSSKGDAPNSRGGAIGTGSEDGATSANEGGFTSSVDGAVTADEGDGGFTSDAPSRMSRRR